MVTLVRFEEWFLVRKRPSQDHVRFAGDSVPFMYHALAPRMRIVPFTAPPLCHSSRVPALCLTWTSVTLYRFASLAVDNLSIKQVGDWFEILQKKRGRRALSQRL